MPATRVFVVGPFPPPVGGVSVINQRIVGIMAEHAEVVPLNVSATSTRRGLRYHLGRASRYAAAARTLLFRRRAPADIAYLACEGDLGLIYTAALSALARLRGYRLYLHHHSFSYIDTPSRLMRLAVSGAGMAALHIFLCGVMRQRFARIYGEQIRYSVISNVACIEPAPAAVETPAAPPAIRIGLLSNLNRVKGLYLFLDILRRARALNLDIDGVLAGPAFDAADLAAITKAQSELGGRLSYLGPVYDVDKHKFFEAIDAFVFPTLYANEAEPVVLCEAMAAGVPVIAFGRGCIAEMLGEDSRVVRADEDFIEVALAQLHGWQQDPATLRGRRLERRKHYALVHARTRAAAADLFAR